MGIKRPWHGTPHTTWTALQEFITDVDATGGVFQTVDGTVHPSSAEEWTDIGDTYLKACKELGVEPFMQEES